MVNRLLFLLLILLCSKAFSQNVGYLQINSDPDGAEVYVDGRLIGKTPIVQYKVPVGNRKIEIRANNYKPKVYNWNCTLYDIFKKNIKLEKGSTFHEEGPGHGNLSHDIGKITVISEPPGALVIFDEDPTSQARTPTSGNIAAGKHNITVMFNNEEMQQKFTIHKTINVAANQPSLLNVKLKEHVAKLSVITEPVGAGIFIDGEYKSRGKSPISINYIKPGSHKITLKKIIGDPLNDVFVLDTTLTLKAKKATLLNINLNKYIGTGYLTVKSNMAGKKIDIRELKYNKYHTLETPLYHIGFYNSNQYQIRWEKEEENRYSMLKFAIKKNRTTEVYIPFYKPLIEYKTVEDHPSYIDEDIFVSYYKPLPETRIYKKYKLGTFSEKERFNIIAYTMLSIPISYLLIKQLSTDGFPKSGQGITAFLMGAGVAIGSIGAIIKTVKNNIISYTEKKSIIENIAVNNKKMAELKEKYNKNFNKWKLEIEKENKLLERKNQEIEHYNNSLPQSSVNYK